MTLTAPTMAQTDAPTDRSEGATRDIEAARKVLETESVALSQLAADLNGPLSIPLTDALDRIAGIAGRVVVTGMGKSGHIARKIAATLASTGTPAFWVHPAEASHGDLGMIQTDDAVIALSNSGETKELSDIVAYTRRFAIPLIALTGRQASTLADAADTALVVPSAPEACPMGLAPTTSTTMMLALGDAIAVALMGRRGFSATDFHTLHPGGKLGQALLRVSDLMHSGKALPIVSENATMADALIEISAKSFGCVAVVRTQDGTLAGIVTDGDLRRHMAPNLLERPVTAVMTANPKSIRPDALAAEALGFMNQRAITSLFAVIDEQPVGIIHIHDCLRAGIA